MWTNSLSDAIRFVRFFLDAKVQINVNLSCLLSMQQLAFFESTPKSQFAPKSFKGDFLKLLIFSFSESTHSLQFLTYLTPVE